MQVQQGFIGVLLFEVLSRVVHCCAYQHHMVLPKLSELSRTLINLKKYSTKYLKDFYKNK